MKTDVLDYGRKGGREPVDFCHPRCKTLSVGIYAIIEESDAIEYVIINGLLIECGNYTVRHTFLLSLLDQIN